MDDPASVVAAAAVDDAARTPVAWFGDRLATGLMEITNDPARLGSGGRWAVLVTFEGQFTAARFGQWRELDPQGDPVPALGRLAGSWRGPGVTSWVSTLAQGEYLAAVASVREHIARGDVYQANICRILRAELPDPTRADVLALGLRLRAGNPAPYAAVLRLPGQGIAVASASPEMFLRRAGRVLSSKPIKGTGRTAADLLDKDFAENVMIVDLVRNDVSQVCQPGSVSVPGLLVLEEHPGLVHLVSEVQGQLRAGVGWPEILAATFPPGSVTGAPKHSALGIIAALERGPRGPYCGALGWVDCDAGTGLLAVGIRTFWKEPGDPAVLAFGTGAGITWGSDAQAEWRETQLKAQNLLRVAAGNDPPDRREAPDGKLPGSALQGRALRGREGQQ